MELFEIQGLFFSVGGGRRRVCGLCRSQNCGGPGCILGCEVLGYFVAWEEIWGRDHVTSLWMTSATFSWRGQNCKTFSYCALINEALEHGEHTRTLLKDELGEGEQPRFIKSLFWNLKKKKKLDLRERPNLGPNEYFFSNMGSLIMKYGPRPWILYRLS